MGWLCVCRGCSRRAGGWRNIHDGREGGGGGEVAAEQDLAADFSRQWPPQSPAALEFQWASRAVSSVVPGSCRVRGGRVELKNEGGV